MVLAVLAACATCSLALDNGLGLVPPLGWNTWCTLGPCGRDYCDENEIKAMADVIVSSGLKDLGYEYVNLDDCWASRRTAQGEITADANRFPSGMKSVADYIHSKGLKYGLYTDAGLYTCSSGERPYKIPGSYGHYEQDAQTYASWGMDFVKMDWCNTVVNGTQLKPEVQYPQMSTALNKTGRPIYFESCEWGVDQPWKWIKPYVNSWRATGDHHDQWSSTADIIEQVADLAPFAGPGGWNYMDFVMTGGQGCPSHVPGERCPGQTDEEYRTEFSMWVIAASPIIVATELRNMTAIQREILLNNEMIAVHQDKLGKAGGRVATPTCAAATKDAPAPPCQVWARPLSDGSKAVALYNSDSVTHHITVSLSILGWATETVSVRDLWAHQDMGNVQGSFSSQVPSHGVTVVRMKPVS